MIKKTEKLIITFYTTTEAMAAEQFFKEKKADGRMIPLPGTISADCGLAWCAKIESEAYLLKLIKEQGLHFQGIYRCLV